MLAVLRSPFCALLAAAALAAPRTPEFASSMARPPIPSGEARLPGDLTVINEMLAIVVQSPPPYGVPWAAIVDIRLRWTSGSSASRQEAAPRSSS